MFKKLDRWTVHNCLTREITEKSRMTAQDTTPTSRPDNDVIIIQTRHTARVILYIFKPNQIDEANGLKWTEPEP